MKWDQVRKDIREELLKKGINPYPHKFPITKTIKEIRSEFKDRDNKTTDPFAFDLSTAGRIANIRRQGKLSFVDIFDEGEKLQLQLRVDVIGEEKYNEFLKYLSRGDIIGVKGDLFFTKRGELTLLVKEWAILAKALIEPPDWSKEGGEMSPEFRYSHRYVDFLYNPQARKFIETRFNVISEIRKFLQSKGFLEVETPILQPVYGGALARPFKTKVNYLDEEWYLRISLELYLKRFIVGGFNKVFEIGKVFRNEDIDVTHNPEFTLMELYWAYADYTDIMELTESMLKEVVKMVNPQGSITYNMGGKEHVIDFNSPFKRISMTEALSESLGRDVESISDEGLVELMKRYQLEPRGGKYVRGLMIEKLFDKLVSTGLIQPTFITDHPKETTPLCKEHRQKKGLIERFELYIAGMELANAYTELNDPVVQAKLFEEEQEMFRKGDLEAHPYDKDFITALSYGMPPTGGLGVGIDRLVMLITNNSSIKEVIPFPMLSAKTFLENP